MTDVELMDLCNEVINTVGICSDIADSDEIHLAITKEQEVKMLAEYNT